MFGNVYVIHPVQNLKLNYKKTHKRAIETTNTNNVNITYYLLPKKIPI